MKKRFYILDSLKAISMIFVIITHYDWSTAQRLNMLFPFWIGMAVPVFLFVSGFVNAAAFERHGIDSLEKAYTKKHLLQKVLRYTIPFLFLVVFELIIDKEIRSEEPLEILYRFIRGGKGSGGYFYGFMMQLIFIFPIIYFIIKKKQKKGLIICFIANFIYEILNRAYFTNYVTYSKLIFRSLFIVAFGAYMYLKKEDFKNWQYWLASLVGTVFIICYDYLGYEPQIFVNWSITSLIAVLYLLPFLKIIVEKLGSLRIKPLEWLGKRTYDILFVQMVYFEYYAVYSYKYIKNDFLGVSVAIVICVSLGCLLHIVESLVTDFVIKKLVKD